MKKGTAIFPGWLFPFVYCVAGVDAYEQTTYGNLLLVYFHQSAFSSVMDGHNVIGVSQGHHGDQPNQLTGLSSGYPVAQGQLIRI